MEYVIPAAVPYFPPDSFVVNETSTVRASAFPAVKTLSAKPAQKRLDVNGIRKSPSAVTICAPIIHFVSVPFLQLHLDLQNQSL